MKSSSGHTHYPVMSNHGHTANERATETIKPLTCSQLPYFYFSFPSRIMSAFISFNMLCMSCMCMCMYVCMYVRRQIQHHDFLLRFPYITLHQRVDAESGASCSVIITSGTMDASMFLLRGDECKFFFAEDCFLVSLCFLFVLFGFVWVLVCGRRFSVFAFRFSLLAFRMPKVWFRGKN